MRAFRRHTAATKDTSDRRLQSHMSKMSTRTSRGYRLASRSFPRCVPVNDAVHAASFASVGFSIVVPGFLFPDTPHGAPNLWRLRHHPGFTQLYASFTRATETASPPYRVNATANTVRDAFLWQGTLLEPFASPSTGVSQPELALGSSFDRLFVAGSLSRQPLDPVRSPQPQPRLAS